MDCDRETVLAHVNNGKQCQLGGQFPIFSIEEGIGHIAFMFAFLGLLKPENSIILIEICLRTLFYLI